MSEYYDNYRHCFNKPDEEDLKQIERYAIPMARALNSPKDGSAQKAALESAIELGHDVMLQNRRTLTVCKSSDLYERMIHHSMRQLRTLRIALQGLKVRHCKTAADGAYFLGFELHLLPRLLGEHSVLIEFLNQKQLTFEHWTKLIQACEKTEVLWPNYFEVTTRNSLIYDPNWNELDRLPEWERLLFTKTYLLNRITGPRLLRHLL